MTCPPLYQKGRSHAAPHARRVGLNDKSCGRFKRYHVDDEAIAHVLVHDPLIGPIDVLGAYQLDIRLDVTGRALVDNFLGFGDTTDHRARKALATESLHHAVVDATIPRRTEVK
jgi:hypothetical protein